MKNRLNLRGVTEGLRLSFCPFACLGGEPTDSVSDMADGWGDEEASGLSMRIGEDMVLDEYFPGGLSEHRDDLVMF